MDKVNRAGNSNRRVFFRIYDEVNLFYQKIDEQSLTATNSVSYSPLISPGWHPDFDMESQDYELPFSSTEEIQPDLMMADSLFNGYKTFNVNISASGMAFMSEDELEEGDCLALRIELAPDKAVVVTYGKIVYCRKNPSDDSEHPFFVGIHFASMSDKDRDVLNGYLDKKRYQRRWVNGIILAAVITVLAVPDVVFSFFAELLHFLFEHLLELSHLSFEFVESGLDHLIEHFFETDLHQTQVIVFYILLSFAFYGIYRLWRSLPPFYRRCKRKQVAYWSRKKSSLLYFWKEQSLFNKIKLVVIGGAAISAYIFLSF